MEPNQLFEPSLYGYIGYCVGFFLRYFIVAGGMYGFFHLVFKQRWAAHRVQQDFPPAKNVVYEIRWSILNTAATGVATLLIYHLIREGRTSMYFDLDARSWKYFALSVFLCIAGYDTWIYWQHRWLHTPWLFRHVHSIHHRLTNPSTFAAFAQHPIETFMGNIYFILFLVYVPIHPFALAAAGAYMFGIGILAHSGYEFYPRGFTRHPVLGWINASTHHNMHHRHVNCNYGNWFNCWDTLLGTNHPAYHDTFDAVADRRAHAWEARRQARRRARTEALEAEVLTRRAA